MDQQAPTDRSAGTDGALGAWAPPPGIAHALHDRPWNDVSRSWHRRSNGALRATMDTFLDREDDHADETAAERDVPLKLQPMRVWVRFSQAIFADELQPIVQLLEEDHPLPALRTDAGIAWDELASEVLSRMVVHLPPPGEPSGAIGHALLTLFAYFEGLVFWEHSMVYERSGGLIAALAELGAAFDQRVGSDPTSVFATRINRAVIDLGKSLLPQFDVEDAIGCTSAKALLAASIDAHAALRSVWTNLLQLWDELASVPDGVLAPADATTLRAMTALLIDDVAQTAPYHEVLATAVAPATISYLRHLRRDTSMPIATIEDELLRSIDRCRQFESSPAGRRSVSATELRAHRLSLEAALNDIRGDQPMIHFDEADITYVIPFGLPVNATGDDPVRRALRAHLEGDALPQVTSIPPLGGVPWTLDDTPQTDAWLDVSDGEGVDYLGVRLIPAAHDLVFQTAGGTLLGGLDLEVRLGALGNHYVRVAVGTQTLVSDDAGATWSADSRSWTPHEVDQFVRRGGGDMGSEAVWLLPKHRHRSDARESIVAPDDAAPSIVAFSARLVADLVGFASELSATASAKGSPSPSAAEDVAENETSIDLIESFLRRHAQVLFTAARASAVTLEGDKPVEDATEVLRLAGAPVMLTAQRPYAQSVLEWLRYPEPTDDERRERMLGGRIRRELLWCSGDTMAIVAPSLPNWQLMETRELIEFAASLTGVYARRHNWLQGALADADHATREALGSAVDARPGEEPTRVAGQDDDLAALTTADLREELSDARSVEQHLNECLNHIQVLLDRSRDFRMSRDLQSRDVMRHICGRNGVVDLQDGLAASVAAAGTQQRLVRARVERLQELLGERLLEEAEQRRRNAEKPMQMLVGVLAVFSFIDLFWWFNDSWTLDNNHSFFAGEFVILLVLATAVGRRTFRIWRSEDQLPGAGSGATDSKSPSASG